VGGCGGFDRANPPDWRRACATVSLVGRPVEELTEPDDDLVVVVGVDDRGVASFVHHAAP
jgi:hypothetical protein